MTIFIEHEHTTAMMKQKLTTVRDVVDAMGGTRKTAQFLGIGDPAVSNMLHDGEIRRGYHLILYLELKRRGYDIDLAVFQIPPRFYEGNAMAAASPAA